MRDEIEVLAYQEQQDEIRDHLSEERQLEQYDHPKD